MAKSIVERMLLMALGSLGTLMALRLSLLPSIDLATGWVLGLMAGLVLLTIMLNRNYRAANNGS